MHRTAPSRWIAAMAGTLVLAAAAAIAEQAAPAFPSRPVRLVVPFAPGGPADSVARAVAPALERSLGQPVVVENRTGADGAVGAQALLAAVPDGHALLLSSASLVPLALLRTPAPFDLRTDFVPVAKLANAPWAMYVSPEVPARTLDEFVTYARANPGKLNYASSTFSDTMAATQFMKASGTSMAKVPYRGAGQVMPDLVAGRVHVNFSPVSGLGLQLAKAGQVRMLAVFSPQRNPMAPDVPTLAEAGLAGTDVSGWLAILAPARTPRDVVDRLNAAVASALADGQVRESLAGQGVLAEPSTPQALAALIEEDAGRWSRFIRQHPRLAE